MPKAKFGILEAESQSKEEETVPPLLPDSEDDSDTESEDEETIESLPPPPAPDNKPIALRARRNPPPGSSAIGVSVIAMKGWVVSISGEAIILRLDSAADITLISTDFHRSLSPPLPIKEGHKINLAQLTDRGTTIKGYTWFKIFVLAVSGEILELEVEAYVVKGMTVPVLLGEDLQWNYEMGVSRNVESDPLFSPNKEKVFFDKITTHIEKLIYGLDQNYKVVAGIYNGITTMELDNLAAETAAYLTTKHPDYAILAAVSLFSFKTLERSYLLHLEGHIVERPQHLIMRVAIGIHGSDIDRVLEMSECYFTHATPTLFESPAAKELNLQVFETIYHSALEASVELAEKDGPYETYPGSPASQGQLQTTCGVCHTSVGPCTPPLPSCSPSVSTLTWSSRLRLAGGAALQGCPPARGSSL
ncbi:hypothetical protein K438DRAFT_1958260 [Mycena galopus ATCC 62051]|nr:hypothetical protein K438DRAFT_1958260 [Mycena galopus ATCC 62051]